MKKPILLLSLLVLAGSLCPAGAQIDTSDLSPIVKQYMQTEKYPDLIIPYLGGKTDTFLYLADNEIHLSGSVLQKSTNLVNSYDQDPVKTLRGLRQHYSLTREEALTLIDWAKLIVRLPVLEETVVVPPDDEKDKELIARYTTAKQELDSKLHDYRNLRVRRQGFATTRLLIRYFVKDVKAAEELRAAPSLEAPDPSLMLDIPVNR